MLSITTLKNNVKIADEMNARRDNSAIIAQANLDNADEVIKLVDQTLSKNNRVDALVNNASTSTPSYRKFLRG